MDKMSVSWFAKDSTPWNKGLTSWTGEELTFLRENYASCQNSLIAEQLGRSVRSVRDKASLLRLRKKGMERYCRGWSFYKEGKLYCRHCGRTRGSKPLKDCPEGHRRRYYNSNIRSIARLRGVSRVIVEQVKATAKCAVCNRPEERLEIDHDHVTGLFRGALCRRCNFLIGFLESNAEILPQIFCYLEKQGSSRLILDSRLTIVGRP